MSALAYLVINNNSRACMDESGDCILNSKKYRLFDDIDDAIKHAVECGLRDPYGMGLVSDKPYTMSQYACGEVNVMFMPIPIIPSSKGNICLNWEEKPETK